MEKRTGRTGRIAIRLEERIRRLLGEITPGKRLALILTVLAVCTVANLYITFNAIYNMGRDSVLPAIGHIDCPPTGKPAGGALYDTFRRERDCGQPPCLIDNPVRALPADTLWMNRQERAG